MSFPNRAILTAPVARDLYAEAQLTGKQHYVAKIIGATNGTLQAWDTLDQDYWTALVDPQITIYGTLAAIPVAVRRYLVNVLRYDDALGTLNPMLKPLMQCGASDYVKTNNGVKLRSAMVAADVPAEWFPAHSWLGAIAETLGSI